ncbi:MAG: AAA family ATPase [Bacilli bacterium]
MRINKIGISGFRNVKGTKIMFNDGITALLATNNYGKSNVLTGLDFAIDFITNQPKIKSKMMRYNDGIPINKTIAGDNFSFEIEYETKIKNMSATVYYRYEFEWIKKGKQGAKLFNEVLRIKTDESTKFSNYVDRNDKRARFKSSPTGRCDKKITVDDNELVINKLSAYDELHYADILKELNSLNFRLGTFFHADNELSNNIITVTRDEDNQTMSLNNGMLELVHIMKEEHPDRFELLVDSFRTLVPSVSVVEPRSIDLKRHEDYENLSGSVSFVIPEKIYDVRIKEEQNNQSTSIKKMSSGSKRIFMLLTFAIMADIENVSLIAFEELENAIHPRLLQSLLIILNEICSNCRIIITSHSPYVVQYLETGNIYIGIPNPNGIAVFSRFKLSGVRSIMRLAEESGTTLGDLIFDMLIDSYNDELDIQPMLESAFEK